MPVMISFTTPDGEEREEHWPSVAAFLAWARVQRASYPFTVYEQDEDGDWAVIEKGRTAGLDPGSGR